MYSQNKEEFAINGLLGDSGRFLDVGAFDGKTFSNTLRLFERGWTGLLLEPSPKAFAGLKRQYSGVPESRAQLLELAVGVETGEIVFYESNGDAISTTDTGHRDKWIAGHNCKFDEMTVKTISWVDLFKKYGSDFDFVNLDTENTNYELIKAYPFEICTPKCFCIEYDNNKFEIMELFKEKGYTDIYTSGENIVFGL